MIFIAFAFAEFGMRYTMSGLEATNEQKVTDSAHLPFVDDHVDMAAAGLVVDDMGAFEPVPEARPPHLRFMFCTG